MLHILPKGERFVVKRQHWYRPYSEKALQVCTKKRKKLTRPRQLLDVPTAPAQRWSMNFVSDQLKMVSASEY